MASCDYCWAAIDKLSVGPTGRMYCSQECLTKDQVSIALQNMWQSVSSKSKEPVVDSQPPSTALPIQIRLKESFTDPSPLSARPEPPPPPPPLPEDSRPQRISDFVVFPSLLPSPQETHNAVASFSLEMIADEIPRFPIPGDRASVSGWWKTFLSVARKFFVDAETRWRLLREFVPPSLIQENPNRKFVDQLESLRDLFDRYFLPRPQNISDLKIVKLPSLATLFDNFRAQVVLALPVGTPAEVIETVARDVLVSRLSEISFMRQASEQWRCLSFEERTLQKLLAIFGETYRKWKPPIPESSSFSSSLPPHSAPVSGEKDFYNKRRRQTATTTEDHQQTSSLSNRGERGTSSSFHHPYVRRNQIPDPSKRE